MSHGSESYVLRQFAAHGDADPAALNGLDWQTQIVYRDIMTPGCWGPVAAALTCALLNIQTIQTTCTTARGDVVLESSAAAICETLARGVTDIAGDWVRQFDDAWPLCFDGRRFGVWRDGCADWSPQTQGFGGLCHALCAAAWRCDIASVEDGQVAPLASALPALILGTPGAAAAALSAVLHDARPAANGRLTPVQALALGGTLLAGGAGMALAWPAAPWLAGAMEAAAAGIMLWAAPHGVDSTERLRLSAWFSNVLPELTVTQIHRLCDRLQGCDARLNVVVLAATLQCALRDGSARSADDAIEQLKVREIEQVAIDRDCRAQSLERFTLAGALEAGVYLLHDAGLLVRSSQEITTRPSSLRVADWYETLDRMDREVSAPSDAWGGAWAATPPTYRTGAWPTASDESAEIRIPLALPVAARRDPGDHGYFGPLKPPPIRDVTPTSVTPPRNATTAPMADPATLIDVRATMTLEQMVTLSEWVAWDKDIGVASALRNYRQRALAYTKRLLQNGYDTFNDKPNATEAVDWDARVEVVYQDVSYLLAPAGGAAGAGMRSRLTFSLMQIALGHHYYEESLSIGGSRTVQAVRLLNSGAANATSRTRAHLNIVNTDDFRSALHRLDMRRIDELSRSPEAIDAFTRYVRSILLTTHMKARTPGLPGAAFWTSPHVFLPPAERLEESLKLELILFRGEIVPGLVAIRHEQSATALLLSFKKRSWYWWRREVESRQTWRDFMRDHLSMLDAERLNDPLRVNALQFAIGPICHPLNGCGARKSSAPHPLVFRTPRFSSIWRADFAFASHPAPEAALWHAEVRRMRQDLDVQIVTPALRARRDWQQFRKAMVQSWLAWFPIANGMLPASAVLPDWTFRLGWVGATVAQVAILLESAETATLSELRAIHSDMGFATVLMAISQVPAAKPFMKAARTVSIAGTTAARQAIAHLTRWVSLGGTVPDARLRLAARARALTHARGAPKSSKQPWVVVSELKSELGLADAVPSHNASQTQTVSSTGFLGRGAHRVPSYELLTRLPAGYAVALTWADGQVVYAGVTCGVGAIAGQSVDDNVMLLPHGGFDMLDVLGEDRDLLTFQSDGRVMCDGYVFDMLVESLEDAIPALEMRRDELLSLRRVPYDRPANASTTLAPCRDGGNTHGVVTSTQQQRERADPHAPKWDVMVRQWRALRSDGSVNATQAIGPWPAGATPVTLATSTTSPTSEVSRNGTRATEQTSVVDRGGASISDVPILRDSLARHWTDRFETALGEVFARVETGLLLWYLGRMPPAQQGMILKRLQQSAPVATLQADDIDIPGVCAMRAERAYLLVSLTTGEVLYGDDVAHMGSDPGIRQFLRRHLSNADAAFFEASSAPGTTPSPAHLPVDIAFQHPAHGFAALVERSQRWMTEQITCAREGAPYCEPVARDHDFVYLVAAAAHRTPGSSVEALIDLVRRSESPGDRDVVPVEHIFRSENATDWRGAPSLPFAYYLGESVRGVEAQLFSRYSTKDVARAVALVSGHIVQSRQRYAVRVIHDDIADLVEFGAGDDRFGLAMLASSEPLRAGRFGPARAAIGDDVLPGIDGRQGADEDARQIQSVREMRDLPAGYEIFLRSDAPIDETESRVHHSMLSLGGGVVAGWFHGNDSAASPMAYRRLDLLSENDYLNFTKSGVGLTDGAPVELWIEPGAPGVFSETAAVAPRSLPVKDIGILLAMKGNSLIDAEIQRNSVDAYRGFDGNKQALLVTMARLLMTFGVVRIKYRLVLSWSTPDQVIPSMSLTLTGQTPHSMFAKQLPAHGAAKTERIVVDLFMSRLLGGAVSRVGDVQSEAQWFATYRQHGGKQCIKYREFDNIPDILSALPEYEQLPGVRPYDHREGAKLIQYPAWRQAPSPGWHPNRRVARRISEFPNT